MPNRYDAGARPGRFGVTVHLLDDGFQHGLARDIDLLLVDAGDLTDRVLPAGRPARPLAAPLLLTR
ncbi:MAG: tetraacyldisaccharide 4'-kinase [Vicinamibacterales bacterium]